MAASFADQIAVRQVEENVFESYLPPHQMGNIVPIAYGGNTMAVGLNAAVQTVQPQLKPYSVLGYFLAPGQLDRPLRCMVQRVRDTRTFATRRIVVLQNLDDGKYRACLEMTVDFQAVEEETIMRYSALPRRQYSAREKTLLYEENFRDLVTQGKLTEDDWKRFNLMFGSGIEYLEQRQCPEGVGGQNMGGFAKQVRTTLDHLHITEKTSAEYVRTKEILPSSNQLAALGYILDAALTLTPLVHDHKMLEDVGACSTLDFALRIFTPELKLDEWHFRERRTIAANVGRTYSEAQFWNERGEMVASMTQQSIMRPKHARKARL